MSVTLEYGIPTDKEALQLRLGIARGFFREEGIDLAFRHADDEHCAVLVFTIRLVVIALW